MEPTVVIAVLVSLASLVAGVLKKLQETKPAKTYTVQITDDNGALISLTSVTAKDAERLASGLNKKSGAATAEDPTKLATP